MPDTPPAPGHAFTIWRALTLIAFMLAAIGIGITVALFIKTDAQANENRETICSIGSFLTVSPPPPRPSSDTTQKEYEAQLKNARAFLVDLRQIDCDSAEFGRAVTADAIDQQLDAIHDVLHGSDPGAG